MKRVIGLSMMIFAMIILVAAYNEKASQLLVTKTELETTKTELEDYKAENVELYPCPFCGSENVELKELCGYFVRCNDCGATGPSHNPTTEVWDENTKAQAVFIWNDAERH